MAAPLSHQGLSRKILWHAFTDVKQMLPGHFSVCTSQPLLNEVCDVIIDSNLNIHSGNECSENEDQLAAVLIFIHLSTSLI
jgi:hypothetical protein